MFEVHDDDEAKNYLVQHGYKIVREFSGSKALYFADPFGPVVPERHR